MGLSGAALADEQDWFGALDVSALGYLRATQAVYRWKACLRKINALFREWQKMVTFNDQARPNNLLASGDEPMFIFLASHEKLPIQSGDIHRHRDPVVAAKVSGFSFNAAFFMRLCRCAKLRFESPV